MEQDNIVGTHFQLNCQETGCTVIEGKVDLQSQHGYQVLMFTQVAKLNFQFCYFISFIFLTS